MRVRTLVAFVLAAAVLAVAAEASHPDDELWIPAAARGQGMAGSFWVTDLVVMNLGDDDVTVELQWLARGADNRGAEGVEVAIAAGATVTFEDVVMSVFGLETAYGALHVEVVDEGEEEGGAGGRAAAASGDAAGIFAHARVYSRDGEGTVGQGLEGYTSAAIVSADGDATTHVLGAAEDERFRSNWYGLNTDEEQTAVDVELLDAGGEVVASRSYVLPPLAPVLYPLADLGVGVGEGTVRFTVTAGEGIFGVSKVDRQTNDPTTLEPHWRGPADDGDPGFTDEFLIERCTFASTGRNPYLVLDPGFRLVLEGEDEGEEIELIISVLDETEVIDGVTTRVVEERESAGGELVEVSRNFLAFCVETGSVFYFGEDVDIYAGGVVVSHDGAWRAGENDASPGILMPGTILLGARYYQEIAPGIALDRGENVAIDLDVETEAGSFDGCLRVDETSPLEPGHVSTKVYAPGIGLIADDVLELVEWADPLLP